MHIDFQDRIAFFLLSDILDGNWLRFSLVQSFSGQLEYLELSPQACCVRLAFTASSRLWAHYPDR
jgi:hypothetical protein